MPNTCIAPHVMHHLTCLPHHQMALPAAHAAHALGGHISVIVFVLPRLVALVAPGCLVGNDVMQRPLQCLVVRQAPDEATDTCRYSFASARTLSNLTNVRIMWPYIATMISSAACSLRNGCQLVRPHETDKMVQHQGAGGRDMLQVCR